MGMKRLTTWLLRTLPVALTILATSATAKDDSLSFLGHAYRLGSYNQKSKPMWEFVRTPETIDNWTTLLTLIDRPDATTRPELDRLAQGVMESYTSRMGKVLMAKTMTDAAGKPYNYLVAAFDQPSRRQFELNFVKAALGPKNAYIVIYGVRVSDPKDYVALSKKFLNEHSGEIGKELETMRLPEPSALPRKEF